MFIRFFIPLLVLFVCCLKLSTCDYEIRCGRIYYRSDNVTAVKLGYCWKYFNYKYTFNKALNLCDHFHARLPAINTEGKAKKLSKFIAASFELYASGQKGSYYKRIYKDGWAGNEIWLSDVVNGRWKSTGVPVSLTQSDEDETGRKCVLFNYQKSTWRYTSCESDSGHHLVICEEKEHVYADDVGAEGMSTPSVTLPPTKAPPPGANFTCPKRYTAFENHCFYLTHGRMSITEAERACNATGGRQAWISESQKKGVVTRYLHANSNKLKPFMMAWLSRLEGNGYVIKWRSSGTDARHFLSVESRIMHPDLMKGVEPKIKIGTSGGASWCRYCVPLNALCEADGIWKNRHPLTEDEEEEPPKNEKFNPNSILTRGRK